MAGTSISNKRIAKNTFFLYCRQLVTMAVALYTVRVVLDVLGAEDYGIYNVIAGFVTSFSFIANTTSSAIQRFFSYSLGQNDFENYRKYFATSFFLFVILSIVALILLETFGRWFIHAKMQIPDGRMDSAMWVFHSSMAVLVFSFIRIPYTAVIISNEKMNLFAYLSISDVLVKLLIVFLLPVISFDKLKVYAALLSCTGLVDFLLNKYFVSRICEEARLSLKIDFSRMRRLLSFSCWNLVGSLSGICRNQGINILQNLYFGPVYNAACGLSFQIYNAINSFASNFIMAVNPQIIKLYAMGKNHDLNLLVERSVKVSFSLLSLVSFPILVLMPFILGIWLGDFPPMTTLFARLIVVNMLVECVSLPLMTLAQATGHIKYYQVAVGGLLILNLPLSWILFKYFHTEAYATFLILIVINIMALFVRLSILKKIADFPVGIFFRNVLIKWLGLLFLLFVGIELSHDQDLKIQLIISGLFTVILIPFAILFFVFGKSERITLLNHIKNKFRR